MFLLPSYFNSLLLFLLPPLLAPSVLTLLHLLPNPTQPMLLSPIPMSYFCHIRPYLSLNPFLFLPLLLVPVSMYFFQIILSLGSLSLPKSALPSLLLILTRTFSQWLQLLFNHIHFCLLLSVMLLFQAHYLFHTSALL